MRYISVGGDNLTTYGFNRYVANIIIALIIYFAGFTKLLIDLLNKKRKSEKKSKNKSDTTTVKTASNEIVAGDK